MADSKPGSLTFALALSTRFNGGRPRLRFDGGVWICSGSTLVDGVGVTPEEAYVDHVEEAWCFWGVFPAGYPL